MTKTTEAPAELTYRERKDNMKRFLINVCIGFCRALLPFSFLLAVIFSPSILMRPRELPWLWRQMWDDPI